MTVLIDENFHGIPVFPCIGNHDTFPPNVLLPNGTSNSIYQDILSKGGWNKYLNDDTFIQHTSRLMHDCKMILISIKIQRFHCRTSNKKKIKQFI